MLKRLLFRENTAASDAALAGLQLFAGLSMAFAHGLGKIPPGEKFLAGVAEMGFPFPSLFAWAAGLSEFVGGLLLAIGLFTRPAALFVAFTMAVAAFGRHAADGYREKELALLYFVLAFYFVVRGGGRFSGDALLRKK